jgi:hypothetical protein
MGKFLCAADAPMRAKTKGGKCLLRRLAAQGRAAGFLISAGRDGKSDPVRFTAVPVKTESRQTGEQVRNQIRENR